MNREEMKKMLPIIQAYVDGKAIQCKEWDFDGHYEWKDFNADWDWRAEYRIKSEPKYRPFKDAEECWNEMLKHEPFGWIKTDNNKRCYVACVFEPDKEGDSMTIETIGYKSFKGALACYTFADGTPFGIKEGGEE